ncbi:hypothetical protein GGI43DRAFT_245332 [Trichoderma evansii]
MDKERRTKIAAALDQYRQTVLQHNIALLRIIVDSLEPLPPSSRLSILADRYRISLPESVKEPQDLFTDDVRAELIRRNWLDGVANRPNPTKREDYFAKIRANITGMDLHFGEEFESVPADLYYLCTLVDGIPGPALPSYTDATQIECITPSSDHIDDLDYIIVPGWDDTGERTDIFLGCWEDWEIAMAFQIGRGPFALCGSCAIYCRNKEDDDNKGWKWRYGMFDGDWTSDMFDTIEGFLVFCSQHGRQTEEVIRKDIGRLGLGRVR